MKLFNEFFQQGNIHISQGLLNRQGHRSIIDILRSQSEVDELFEGGHAGQSRISGERIDALLDIILYRLYIVICNRLNLLHPLGISRRELSVDVT